MNKNEFMGFKQVFLFEFMTGITKPAFKIFLGIVCAIAFLAMPIITIVGNIKGSEDSSDSASQKSDIETVYIYNETDLSLDFEAMKDSEKYSDVSFITDSGMSYDEAVEALKEEKDHKNLVLKIEYDEKEGFDITMLHSEKSGLKDNSLSSFNEDYQEFFKEEALKNLGVSDDDYEYMSKDIIVTVMKPAKNGTFVEDTGSISTSDYTMMLAGLFTVFMFINIAASNVATSVATEKSSRVIEYLLTGTRPLALLSGKIVARLAETIIMTVASYSCMFMSQVVCLFLNADKAAAETAVADSTSSNMVVVSSFWETISFSQIAIGVLYFMAGLALFSIIGALTGASVSKLDELQDAYRFYTLVLVVSVYTDMFLIIMMLNSSGLDGLIYFCTMFPLTGAFLTPTLIITGKISVLTGFIALIIIIITATVAFIFASAIYESMLLFQGKRLRGKDIVALMKKQVIT